MSTTTQVFLIVFGFAGYAFAVWFGRRNVQLVQDNVRLKHELEKAAKHRLGTAVTNLNNKMYAVRPGEVTIVIRDKDALADMFAFEIKQERN